MIRFMSEFFRPEKKCDRLGHVPGVARSKGWKWPGEGYRSVADEVIESRPCCCRCNVTLGEVSFEITDSLQGLSMASSKWDKLKEDGFLFREFIGIEKSAAEASDE